MKTKTTRGALLMSALALFLCVSMLVGTTFAWFTDSVTSANNVIASGNLDVVLEYWDGDSYEEITSATKLFDDEALWEPGHTEVAYLKISNAGSLALKYQLNVNVVKETVGKAVSGADLKLSEHLVFSVVDKEITAEADLYTREEAINVAGDAKGLNSYKGPTTPLEVKNADGSNNYADYVALIIYMPDDVGNEANHNGEDLPAIEMGVNLLATQYTAEEDSFDDQYDKDAELPWDKTSTKAPELVNGSYAVGSPAELAWIAARTAKTLKFHLTADIDMMGATVSAIELESYHTVEGNGKTISNVVVNGNGLFGNVSADGNIRNLILDNVTVNAESGDYAGIVNGKYSGNYTNVTVKNSTVYAPNSEYVGGLAGAYYKNIQDCKVENISVTGTEKVGGLVGFFTLADIGYSIHLSNCSASNVTVTALNQAKPYAGVIFGRGLATGSHKFVFENCSAALKNGQVLIGQDYYNNIDVSTITVTNID